MHIITNDALIEILREQIFRNGGPSSYARRLGISCAFVSALMKGKKYVSGTVLQDLGYERVICFRKAKTGEQSEGDGVNQRSL